MNEKRRDYSISSDQEVLYKRIGKGPVFTDPDPDAMREVFQGKSRRLESSVMSVKEAVSQFVHDGDYIGVGGFGSNRIPTAILHQIVRDGIKELGFAGHTSTHDLQILAAGEAVDRCDVAYVVGLEARGLSKNTRRLFEGGRIAVSEWTNATLAWRYKAAAMGLSFLPARSMLGTDTALYSGAVKIPCPFTGKEYCAVPALYPDVGIIHVHACDQYGNAQIRGITVSDLDLARASKRLIITTEEIIPDGEIREEPDRTVIPYYLVDAVVEVPYGAYPSNMAYCYFSDELHLREWLSAEKDPLIFQEFLQKNILDVKDHWEYLAINGGLKRMHQLQLEERMPVTGGEEE